jgi:uncharacterized membrane protein
MAINLTVVAIYIMHAWMCHGSSQHPNVPMILSVATVILLPISGWPGGNMIYEAGAGVSRLA